MRKKVFVVFAAMFLETSITFLWAGDAATFVDLGFSPDGKTYMFGQYGVQTGALKPWAELFIVDVVKNNLVPGGRISYVHNQQIVSGQDGSGVLFRLISQNAALMERYRIDHTLQGLPLFIAMHTASTSTGETVEFRDYRNNYSYKAVLRPSVEGAGTGLKSSFYITLDRTADSGNKITYVAGTPAYKRPMVASYRIKKALIAPKGDALIFVVEMIRHGADGPELRYMVEALRL